MACPAPARLAIHLASSASVSQVLTNRTDFLSMSRRTSLPRETRCEAGADLEEPVTVDNSTVLVVGGGGVGMETVRVLAKAGSWVTAYQRNEKFRPEIEGLGSMLALGDVLDVATIEKVLRSNSFDAIVCTVGGGTTHPEVDKDGPINLANAAKKAGVKRFIMISSVGAGDSVKAVDDKTLAVLKTVLEAKEVAEEAVKSSGLSYTIIRPGGLLAAPPTGNGILTENSGVSGLISRADVASLVMKVLFNEKSYGKTVTAIDQDKLLPPTTSLDGVELLNL